MSHRLIVDAAAEHDIEVAYRWYVFFSISDNTAHALAVIHAAQDPDYIAERLGAV